MRYAMLWLVVALNVSGTGCDTPQCDPRYGDCPPPEPGVYVDELGLSRSVWFHSDSIGASSEICTGDVREYPGAEVILRGAQTVVIVERDAIAPSRSVTIRTDDPRDIEFADMQGDGNAEFVVTQGTFQNRSTEFRRDDGTLMFRYPSAGINWQALPVAGDPMLKVVVFDFSEALASLWDEQGNRIARFANIRPRLAFVANLNEDPELEIVLAGYSVIDGEPELTVWDWNGDFIADFGGPNFATEEPLIAALRDEPNRHYLGFDCVLYDLAGNVVSDDVTQWLMVKDGATQADDGTPRECRDFRRTLTRPAPLTITCPYSNDPKRVPIRFGTANQAYLVEVSNSVITSLGIPFVGGGAFDPLRVIVRIYRDNQLVYHEVIASESNPGAYLIIDSVVADREALLVADGNRILLYHLPE